MGGTKYKEQRFPFIGMREEPASLLETNRREMSHECLGFDQMGFTHVTSCQFGRGSIEAAQ